MRASLNAKLERLLERPLIGRIAVSLAGAERALPDDDLPGAFRALQTAARALTPDADLAGRTSPWREDPEDGTCSVRISIDYDDVWRGCEREVLETVSGAIESAVSFLTEQQKLLLERSPREFLALSPGPETAELVGIETERYGSSARVVELKVAAAPESRAHIRYIAIVPNLVQIERQLDALHRIECAADDGPLAPLRALLGLCDHVLLGPRPGDASVGGDGPTSNERLDEHQAECIRKAMSTPHFAVIQGPPGSGKTTVITAIIRRALGRGERVLVVSPTHVAVDNVVEKLTPAQGPTQGDRLEEHTLPVRYAARTKKLSERALAYWVGSKKQRRGASIARRVQRRLSETIPFAQALFAMEDKDAAGTALLSSAVARVEAVVCGTPIGILSFETVKNADPGSFGLLIVDEVSKMTLPEFLAIAIKARRWVLVGDPEQLPPFNGSEENATTLDDVLDPLLEVVCSVGGILERARPATRRDERLVVISSDPGRALAGIHAHLSAVMPRDLPPITALDDARGAGIVVCSPAEADRACEIVSPMRGRDRTHNPDRTGTTRILVERGIRFPRPDVARGPKLVEARARAQALVFENSFNVYHAQPWSVRSGQKLQVVTFRNGLEKYLPSAAALGALAGAGDDERSAAEQRRALLDAIAERLAVNTVSVYDWLVGIPTASFDTSPLRELGALSPAALVAAVRPFVGTLKKQYRMHGSLSRVPRELFYFGEALHDGRRDDGRGCRVSLLQVASEGDARESNGREIEAISRLLVGLNADDAARVRRPGIMVITPYREQEARLVAAVEALRASGSISNLDVEVCTLDRCQGREAEYVLVSLVRSRATAFLDMPKRWNVALTRAMQGLFIIGDVDAYLEEARAERRYQAAARGGDGKVGPRRPIMSLLARIIEAYHHQITESVRPARDDAHHRREGQ